MTKDFETLVDMGICDKETALRIYDEKGEVV